LSKDKESKRVITRIETLNYKCLRYVDQELSPFHVLIGPNASGKSTLLDVIAFLGDLLNDGLEAAVLGKYEPGSVGRARSLEELFFGGEGGKFELAVEMRIPDNLRPKSGAYSHCRYDVAVGINSESGEMELLGETLCLFREKHSPGNYIVQKTLFPEELTPPGTILKAPGRKKAPKGWRKIVNKISESGNDSFQAEMGGWNSSFRIGPRKAALANLPEDPDRFPVAIWARRFLMEGIRVLRLNSLAMRQPCSPSLPASLKPDGSNLPIVVRSLREKEKARFGDWLDHVRTVLADVRDVQVIERPEDRHLYLKVIYDTDLKVPSWLLSDGTLRFLALTLLAYIPEQTANTITLVEEPENGIHPRAVEAAFQSLSSVYEGQVLLATHSPLILGLAEPAQILCFARTAGGATDIVRGDQHPALRDWKRETSLADLYAAGVLA
jgi:predicted ATPase